MRLAVIDCGTNTFNLLVIELVNKFTYSKLYNMRIPVKLGQGGINKGYIEEPAFDRAIRAIAEFKNVITKYQIDKTLAFATSAIRDAENGEKLVEQVKKQSGIEITVIDGEKEALLIYLGIKEAVKLNDSVSLIMDIGGGSNEFILANKHEVFWKQSFNIGAARLLERFQPSDPITESEITSINNYLELELRSLFEAVTLYSPQELIGSSGAFESIIEIIHGELQGEEFTSSKTEYEINLNDHFSVSSLIIASTFEQRKKIRGLVPMRLDMIVISCLMMDFILNKFSLNKIKVSTYSLKEGALMEFINSKFT